jgi:hypothetical protein
MNISQCVDEVLVRGLDDWIQAAEVASIARTRGGAREDDEVRRISIEVVRELLGRNLMEIGDVSVAGFRSWNLSALDALARIDADWRNLPNGPELGQLFWLALTESGQRIAGESLERTRSNRS